MIDFKERVKQKHLEEIADIVTAESFLQTIEELTQQLNFAFSIETDKKLPEVLKRSLPVLDNNQIWMVRKLCHIHGQNMLVFGRYLEHIAEPLNEEQEAVIKQKLKDLPNKYREQGAPLIDHYIARCLELLEELSEESAADHAINIEEQHIS